MKVNAAAGAAALALTAAACSSAASTSATPRHLVNTAAPNAAPSASAPPGQLAFVSGGQLYVVHRRHSGTMVRRIAVPAARHALAPAWASDGRWLAYLVTRRTSDDAGSVGTLWLARADGTSARPVMHHVNRLAWSPTANVLAVDQVARGVNGSSHAWLVRPGRDPRRIAGTADAVVWSPDGSRLAFSATVKTARRGPFYGVLGTVNATDGDRTECYHSRENLMLLRGWTEDGRSLLAWADAQGSASLAADGLPLLAVSVATGRATKLAVTLADPGLVSTSPQTRDIALAAGRDRVLADDKRIELCQTTGTCRSLPGGQPGATGLDPALSGTDYQLAVVHAATKPPPTTAPPYAQRSIRAWYQTRTLWLDPYTGGNPHRLRAAGTGVASPQWSRNGRSILYVRNNAIWLVHANGDRSARRIAGPLFQGRWPNYYGYIDWGDQFAWTG